MIPVSWCNQAGLTQPPSISGLDVRRRKCCLWGSRVAEGKNTLQQIHSHHGQWQLPSYSRLGHHWQKRVAAHLRKLDYFSQKAIRSVGLPQKFLHTVKCPAQQQRFMHAQAAISNENLGLVCVEMIGFGTPSQDVH